MRAAGLGGAAALLAACGGSESGGAAKGGQASSSAVANAVRAPAAEQEKPQRGGTLNLSVQSQMGNLHPKQVGGSTLTPRHTYDRLLSSIWPEGTYELSAAAAVEQPEQTKVIFKIKPNAKFQLLLPTNGRPVTSEDTAVSWNVCKDDARQRRQGGLHAVYGEAGDAGRRHRGLQG